MRDILADFHFVPDGATTPAVALCNYLRNEIAFGRIKGGERLPTIRDIAQATGLSFWKVRSVMSRLLREGYVRSRPHTGTVAVSRGENVLHGRVLFVLPVVDACWFHAAQLIVNLGGMLSEAGYALSVATFTFGENDDLAFLKKALGHSPELVVAFRASERVKRLLAESGIAYINTCGESPAAGNSHEIFFSPEAAISQLIRHCHKAGVKQVVQVVAEDGDMFDARTAFARAGMACSTVKVPCGKSGDDSGNGVMHCAYEVFAAMPREDLKGLFLFWNPMITQGAVTAFLERDVRVPEEVKMVTLSVGGVVPVYTKPFTRFEVDPVKTGQSLSDFALSVLAKGRIPRPPKITLQYVFGETFPFEMGR